MLGDINGKTFIMCLYPVKIRPHKKGEPRGSGEVIEVSCGKCLECERNKAIEWSFRIMDECSKYEHNAFITLTYSPEFLPDPPFVSRRELQLFMKSFRQEIAPLKIRFFACGEYGKKNLRPHYHAIIFGWFPNDAWLWKTEDGVEYFRSAILEKVWKKGFSVIGKVTEKTALYCAKYMNKFSYKYLSKQLRPLVVEGEITPFYEVVTPPFIQMSNRPGIGYDSVYECDLRSDRIYRNGKSIKIPRYYLKVMERDGIFLDDFREARAKTGEMRARLVDLDKKRERYYEKFLRKKFIKTIDK